MREAGQGVDALGWSVGGSRPGLPVGARSTSSTLSVDRQLPPDHQLAPTPLQPSHSTNRPHVQVRRVPGAVVRVQQPAPRPPGQVPLAPLPPAAATGRACVRELAAPASPSRLARPDPDPGARPLTVLKLPATRSTSSRAPPTAVFTAWARTGPTAAATARHRPGRSSGTRPRARRSGSPRPSLPAPGKSSRVRSCATATSSNQWRRPAGRRVRRLRAWTSAGPS